jgi:hypothetical protein
MSEKDKEKEASEPKSRLISDMSEQELNKLYKRMIETAPNKEIKDALNKIINK